MSQLQQSQRSFINKAKSLARVMARENKIEVTISGDGAYCSEGRINLPLGDYSDQVWREMLEGWIDHELGHLAFTDIRVMQTAGQISEFHQHILNCIEDVWMEKAQGDRFPGARINLEKLSGHAIARNLFPKCSDLPTAHPLAVLDCLILYRGRALVTGQDVLKEHALDAYQMACQVYGQELADKFCVEIDSVASVMNTGDAFKIMLRIVELLQNESDDDQPDENDDGQGGSEDNSDEQSDDSSDDNSGEQSEDSSDDNSDEQSEDSSDDNSDEQSDDSSDDNSDEQSDDSSDDNSGEQSDDSSDDQTENDDGQKDSKSDIDDVDSNGQYGVKQPSKAEIKEAVQAALKSDDNDGLPDFHEALAEMLSEDAEEAQDDNPSLLAGGGALLGDWEPPVRMEVDSAAARAMSGRIYPALNKVLFDQLETLPVARNRGNRLIANKLSGVPAGNFSVFRKRVEQQDLTAAISILVDASGSMKESGKMAKANACSLALAKGLHKAGVPTNVTYFGVWDGENNRTFTAKHFDERAIDSKFGVPALGGTPTAQGMLVAMNQLVLRNELRKVMFIITDGQPDDSDAVSKMAELARSFGIKVVPIGIETGMVCGFSADEFVCVTGIDELPGALKQAVKNKLFN